MAFLDFLKKKKNDPGKSYLKQLLKVAMTDGQLDDSEFEYIKQVAAKNGISEEEVLDIKENIHAIKFVEPVNSTQRFQLIFDLVWMMMIDGTIDVSEIHFCSRVAVKLGYEAQIVPDLVDTIKSNLDNGISAEETYNKLCNPTV